MSKSRTYLVPVTDHTNGAVCRAVLRIIAELEKGDPEKVISLTQPALAVTDADRI